MRKYAEHLLRKASIDVYAKGLLRNLRSVKRLFSWNLKRKFGRVDSAVDRAIIERYFAERGIRKLHIACGGNVLVGWLNSDIFPFLENILHLDATDPFPFRNNTFDFIFCEHMIEHISYSNGLMMLSECHRVLRKNGKIRISTPNLPFLIDLYKDQKSELQKEYIKWATDNFIKTAPYYDDTFVINNFVRDWGHLFIYDEKTLRSSFEKAGFAGITRWDLNESEDEALRNLENEERMPKGFLKMESVILEGKKLLDS
jgi:predicted SAM-dependent methyltransferase